MKTQIVRTGLTLAGLQLVLACSPVEFRQIASESITRSVTPQPDLVITPEPQPSPPPILPVPVPPAPPAPVVTKGACADDSSTRLLSCMNCLVPLPPPLPPQFSKKGQALLDIMTASCQVKNKSDPTGYVPPSRAELLGRLNRLSPSLYPDTPMTALQISTVDSLLTNPKAVKDMFGGIFYSGVTPQTVAFETYFGIETIEARYTFCYASAANGTAEGISSTFNRFNSTPLHSKAWIDCQYGSDPSNCRENAAYQAGNVYRNQLRTSMNESINRPYIAPKPIPIAKCDWEKFEGLYDERADRQIQVWLASGYKIGGEVTASTPAQNMCAEIKAPVAGVTGKISMAAYRCQ